jgi:polysaccharide export outer membrane protein
MKKNKELSPLLLISLILTIAITLPAMAQDQSTSAAVKTWSAKGGKSVYRIGPGDILEITTWKEEDLSREEVLVRIDGMISFPLLSDVQAAGLTPMKLKENIESGLKKFVDNPVVTVNVVDPASQKIYVLGEVEETGEYPLTKRLTVLQAFALAGGFTEWASKKEIILLRNEGGKEKIYRLDYRDITKGKDLSQNVQLRADDTIIVP